MPQHTYQTPADAKGFVDDWRVTSSVSSGRDPKGNLVLRNNPYQLLAGKLGPRRYNAGYDSWCWKKANAGSDVPYQATQALGLSKLEERCYSKLRAKLYRGSASLGVTAATYKEARGMIVDRYRTLTTKADNLLASALVSESRYSWRRGFRSRHLENLSSLHLEIIFGWTPLLQDIVAATTSVIQKSDERTFVTVSDQSQTLYKAGIDTWHCEARVSYSAGVVIQNRNAWLAERAGLINPLTVAWDLVPWSFVVNMFVNTGQLVQSVTDFAGLQFTDCYKTTSRRYRANRVAPAQGVYSSMQGIHKVRAQSSLPPVPNLQFRLPEANWETAAMAASLFTQKFGRVSKALQPFLLVPPGTINDGILPSRRKSRT